MQHLEKQYCKDSLFLNHICTRTFALKMGMIAQAHSEVKLRGSHAVCILWCTHPPPPVPPFLLPHELQSQGHCRICDIGGSTYNVSRLWSGICTSLIANAIDASLHAWL